MNELLDRQAILEALGADARAQLQSIEVALETTSTQADALATASPRQGCAVFFAERQTAGQGRRGRSWTSPTSANLYMSVARRFENELAALSGLSLVAGIAIAEALNAPCTCRSGFSREAPAQTPIGLKWPNDLIGDGRKLGGILVQLRADAGHGSAAVIGIGINVRMPASAASDIDQPWCDLSQLGRSELSRNGLAAALLDRLLPALDHFEREGLPPFVARWQALDVLAGQPVRVLDGPRTHQGISQGITESGALRILDGETERTFHSGDVSLRAA